MEEAVDHLSEVALAGIAVFVLGEIVDELEVPADGLAVAEADVGIAGIVVEEMAGEGVRMFEGCKWRGLAYRHSRSGEAAESGWDAASAPGWSLFFEWCFSKMAVNPSAWVVVLDVAVETYHSA